MSDRTDRANLILFREKVQKLERSTVVQALTAGGLRFNVRAQVGEPIQLGLNVPQDSVEAFVLTLRMLYQGQDRMSLRQVAESIVSDESVPDDLVERMQKTREAFNAYLDTPCPIEVFGSQPTQREVFLVFLYGGFAHAEEGKKKVFDEWAENPMVFGVMQQVFMGAATAFWRCALGYRDILDAIEARKNAG